MGDEVLASCVSTVEPQAYDLNEADPGAPDQGSETPTECMVGPVE